MNRRAKTLQARSGATRDATGTVRTIATAAWVERGVKAALATVVVLTNNGRRMEVAVSTRPALLLEASYFAAMEHSSVARAPAIARDNRVGELGSFASLLVLAVHRAFLYLKLDAAIVGSAVVVVGSKGARSIGRDDCIRLAC